MIRAHLLTTSFYRWCCAMSDTRVNSSLTVPDKFYSLDKAEKQNWIVEKLQSTGYSVNRNGFGLIEFAKKRLKSAFNYFRKNSTEEAVFEALPYVLRDGIEIGKHSQHKGRNYGTVTIAAPVSVNGVRGNMAAVVKQTTGNYYKVHRILSPDGAEFILDIKEEAAPTSGGGVTNKGSLATPISSASTNIVTDQRNNVKESFSADIDDAAYLEAVQRGDMETAQRMVDEAAKTAGFTVRGFHGSGEKFNTFSYGHIGSATGVGILGEGFYFGDDERLAKMYGAQVYDSYLRMENTYHATEKEQYTQRAALVQNRIVIIFSHRQKNRAELNCPVKHFILLARVLWQDFRLADRQNSPRHSSAYPSPSALQIARTGSFAANLHDNRLPQHR